MKILAETCQVRFSLVALFSTKMKQIQWVDQIFYLNSCHRKSRRSLGRSGGLCLVQVCCTCGLRSIWNEYFRILKERKCERDKLRNIRWRLWHDVFRPSTCGWRIRRTRSGGLRAGVNSTSGVYTSTLDNSKMKSMNNLKQYFQSGQILQRVPSSIPGQSDSTGGEAKLEARRCWGELTGRLLGRVCETSVGQH